MQQKKPGTVRIIAGRWRGRRLPVPDLAGLRPSGDRGREVLFNWLQPFLRGAHCLDLFAGTGVLGLEAISRGAASAVLVECSRIAAAVIRDSIERMQAEQVEVVEADALRWMQSQAAHSADIVFIDPPFGQSLAMPAMHSLLSADILRPDGWVYVETARAEKPAEEGEQLELVKEKLLGEVRMQLFRGSPKGGDK